MPRPRRPKLGQHFLQDTSFRHRILASLSFQPRELVFEIGPGRGAMTELLVGRCRRVVAVELDGTLATELRNKFAACPQVVVLNQDILATNLADLCEQNQAEQCFVFGNLPYYITSPILHHLIDFAASIRAMTLLVQREVAERIVAQPGSRDYGYLSVLAQVHSQPRIALSVPPGAFAPPPKVHSALVDFEMTPKFPAWAPAERDEFLGFVKHCFAQKRKNVLNNLSGVYTRRRVLGALGDLDLPASARAEELPIGQLAKLFSNLGEKAD